LSRRHVGTIDHRGGVEEERMGSGTRRTIGIIGLAAIVAGGGSAVPRGWAQPGLPHTAAGSPPPHMLAQMCATAFEHNIGMGHGFGMAFVADQQDYPGPRHVLELKDRLTLTPEQEARTQALLTAMYAESRPKSARWLEAEAKLRQVFAGGQANEATVRAAVAEVEKARAELRLVHLMTHLKMRDVLTDEQRRLYHEARWSAHGPMGPHRGSPMAPHGGGPHEGGARPK
jgi:Spy/CpxP family protein refolding chaperone